MAGVGVLGGSFNPIHNGHLHVAQQVRERLALDKVILVPAGLPPHKPRDALADARHRYCMAIVACHNLRGLEVSDLEVRNSEVSYTIDTVRRLKELAGGDTLHLILGADAVAELHTWKDAETLVWEVQPALVARPGWSLELAITRLEQQFRPETVERLLAAIVEIPAVPFSGTEVRRRLAAGQPVSGLVRWHVEQYIRQHGLYGAGRPES